MENLKIFSQDHIEIVDRAVTMSEELVSNAYKMSTSQWLRGKYDVKTLSDLAPNEIVDGPFAQLIRYEGQRKDSNLGSASYDLYKICLQDHSILRTLEEYPNITLMPFTLYVVIHELVHVVRFSMFVQNFNASEDEMMVEEKRVHTKTHEILKDVRVVGMENVLDFFNQWREPFVELRIS